MFKVEEVFTPEQQLAFDKAILQDGVNSQIFEWFRRELQKERAAAISDLTHISARPDNIGEFAAAQARLFLTTVLLKRPYDLLGISEPR